MNEESDGELHARIVRKLAVRRTAWGELYTLCAMARPAAAESTVLGPGWVRVVLYGISERQLAELRAMVDDVMPAEYVVELERRFMSDERAEALWRIIGAAIQSLPSLTLRGEMRVERGDLFIQWTLYERERQLRHGIGRYIATELLAAAQGEWFLQQELGGMVNELRRTIIRSRFRPPSVS